MGQVTREICEWIKSYHEDGKVFPVTAHELNQLAYMASKYLEQRGSVVLPLDVAKRCAEAIAPYAEFYIHTGATLDAAIAQASEAKV